MTDPTMETPITYDEPFTWDTLYPGLEPPPAPAPAAPGILGQIEQRNALAMRALDENRYDDAYHILEAQRNFLAHLRAQLERAV